MKPNEGTDAKAGILDSPEITGSTSSRRRWETPAMRRLAASAAEFGGGSHPDSEGTS